MFKYFAWYLVGNCKLKTHVKRCVCVCVLGGGGGEGWTRPIIPCRTTQVKTNCQTVDVRGDDPTTRRKLHKWVKLTIHL